MERDDNHHHMYRKEIEGVTKLVTRISHGTDEIGDALVKLMGNQLCLQLKEFWQLIEFPLDEEAWVALVRERCAEGRNAIAFTSSRRRTFCRLSFLPSSVGNTGRSAA